MTGALYSQNFNSVRGKGCKKHVEELAIYLISLEPRTFCKNSQHLTSEPLGPFMKERHKIVAAIVASKFCQDTMTKNMKSDLSFDKLDLCPLPMLNRLQHRLLHLFRVATKL